MRIRVFTATAALLLASATHAMAQTTPAEATSGTTAGAATGTMDVGFRISDVSGDEARFERYRDLRNGLYTNIVFGKLTDTYLFDVTANNVGYRDQYYTVDYQNSRMKFSFVWDSIPLNYCYNCLTPWREASANSWTLDDAVQQQVQNSRPQRPGGPTTPLPPGSVAIPTSAAQLSSASVYRAQAQTFEIQQRRDVAGFKFGYDMTTDVALNVDFTTTKKSGYQPFGMSHAFGNANELPMQLDNRTNDFGAAVEWVRPKGMFRAAFEHSMFSNQFNAVEWDNPLQLTDYNNGLVPPTGPFDPSGYSNGNGAARGRISSFPDNSMTVVSFMGLYKFNRTTTVNGTVQISDQTNDDELIPWTTNASINQPIVWASFPFLAELPRPTAEAKVRGVNALVNFTSRPTRKIGFNAKYRHNTHANISRPFPYDENVRFDAVPEESTGQMAEGHSVIRDTVDASMSFHVMPFSTIRIGYVFDNFDRTGRTHNDMRDQGIRATWDTTGNQFVSLRVGYEFIARTGDGFSEQAVEDAAAQPGLRFYDEADRDRNRFNALVTLTPMPTVDLTASVTYTDDQYGGPGLEFGLLSNTNTAFNLGANFTPSDHVAMGVNYGRDDFTTFQKARNANPAPDPSWTDPRRDWTLDNDEIVNNFDLYLDLLNTFKNTGIRFAWSYSDSDNGFLLGGPRVDPSVAGSLAALGQFEQLPNVTNTWQQFMVDLKYSFSSKVGFALGYFYEKLDISDFATIDTNGSVGFTSATGNPRIDYLGGLTTGYGNRPYKGSTFTARLLYTF
jgi:MtrB/PioB family decaheme-associated outer membrane protein